MYTNESLKYSKIARIARIVWIVSALIFGLSQIARGMDLKIEHFEDGSGRITYCLPFESAGPYLGGCN